MATSWVGVAVAVFTLVANGLVFTLVADGVTIHNPTTFWLVAPIQLAL